MLTLGKTRQIGLVICAIVVMVLSFLAGAAGEEPETVTLGGWTYMPEIVEQNLDLFEDQYGIPAEFVHFPGTAYRDRMVISFIGGTEFDIIYVRDTEFGEWISAGWLYPLEGFPDIEDVKKNLAQFAISGGSYEGTLYGLPYYSSPKLFMYNQEHLERAGISKPPATWDEVVQQARVLKEKGIVRYPVILVLGQSPLGISDYLDALVASFGSTLFDEAGNPIMQLPDNPTRDVLLMLKSMYEEGLLDPSSLTFGSQTEAANSVGAGLNTFGIFEDYLLRTLNDPNKSAEAGKFVAKLLPGGNGVATGTIARARLYCITSASEDKESAWKLLKFLSGKDKYGNFYVPKRWAIEAGLGFAVMPLYEDEVVQAALSSWIDPGIVKAAYETATDAVVRRSPWFAEWELVARVEFQKALLGIKEIDAVLNDLAQEAEELR